MSSERIITFREATVAELQMIYEQLPMLEKEKLDAFLLWVEDVPNVTLTITY